MLYKKLNHKQNKGDGEKNEDLDGRVFCPSCCPKRTGVKDRQVARCKGQTVSQV